MARGLVLAGINEPDLSVEATPVGLDRIPILG
jgi:hypothetical protein